MLRPGNSLPLLYVLNRFGKNEGGPLPLLTVNSLRATPAIAFNP